MTPSTATFTDIAHMGIFCAELTKQGVKYNVTAYNDVMYIVNITGF
jgi:hypothetical protein